MPPQKVKREKIDPRLVICLSKTNVFGHRPGAKPACEINELAIWTRSDNSSWFAMIEEMFGGSTEAMIDTGSE
jgi:hypothetical protein